MQTNVMPRILGVDRGSETGKMAAVPAFLYKNRSEFADPMESVIYSPSTTNLVSFSL